MVPEEINSCETFALGFSGIKCEAFLSEFAVNYLSKRPTVSFMQQRRLNVFAWDVCQTQTKLKDAVSEKALTDLKGNRV